MSGFTLPTSRPITQPWAAEFDDWDGDGIVDYPGGFYNSIGWNGHNGIDYGCHEGDPIEAIADGVVSFAAWAGNHWLLSGGGNAILVEHVAYGIQSEYLHLSRFAVTAGQSVSKGQVIGYAGKTGAATAAHLHLGVLPLTGINVNNRMRGRIDPTPFLYGGLAAQGTITEEEYMASPEWFGAVIQAVARTEDMVTKIHDRVFGRDVQRHFNPQTLEVRTEPFTGSVPARSTDVHDVISTNNLIASQSNKILDAVAGIPGVDPAVVAGLRQELSAELKSVVNGLSITFTPKQEAAETNG